MRTSELKSFTLHNTAVVILLCLSALQIWHYHWQSYRASYSAASKTLTISAPNGDSMVEASKMLLEPATNGQEPAPRQDMFYQSYVQKVPGTLNTLALTNAFESQTIPEPLRETLVVDKDGTTQIYFSTNNRPTVYLAQKEYEWLEQHDAILGFVKRVNDSAVASPIWDSDNKSALYEAFHKEANTHTLKLIQECP